jgi:hypothetical protein
MKTIPNAPRPRVAGPGPSSEHGGDPTLMRGAELDAFRDRVLDALGALKTHKGLAAQLVNAYKKAPAR